MLVKSDIENYVNAAKKYLKTPKEIRFENARNNILANPTSAGLVYGKLTNEDIERTIKSQISIEWDKTKTIENIYNMLLEAEDKIVVLPTLKTHESLIDIGTKFWHNCLTNVGIGCQVKQLYMPRNYVHILRVLPYYEDTPPNTYVSHIPHKVGKIGSISISVIPQPYIEKFGPVIILEQYYNKYTTLYNFADDVSRWNITFSVNNIWEG